MAENKSKADGASKPMSKSAVFQMLSEKTNLTKKQVAEFFDALTDLIKRELGKKGPGAVNVIPGLLQLKLKPHARHQGPQGPQPLQARQDDDNQGQTGPQRGPAAGAQGAQGVGEVSPFW